MKICTKCKCEKELTEFYRHIGNKSGYQSQCKKCMDTYSKQHRKNNPKYRRKMVYWYYYKSAKRRGYSFCLTREQFENIIMQPCWYCGSMPIPRNGIDRQDNSKGYEIGNCVPCCTKCNLLKSDMSYEDFCLWITKVFNYRIRSVINEQTHLNVDG